MVTNFSRGRNTGPGCELPDTQDEEILLLAENYPRGRNTVHGWELPDTHEEEILDLAGNYLIPKTKKYCSLLRITQDSLLRITLDEEILYMAGNYQIPMRKKYWTWLGITWYQCCGSMTFWVGSGSGSADPCLWLMDPDPSIFVIDLQDASKKLIF